MTINKNTLFALIATGVMVGALVMTGANPSNNQNPRADLNCDGKVDIRDLVLLAKNFGKTCCP